MQKSATHLCECGLLHWRRMRSICKFDAVSLRRRRNPTGVEQRIYANADFCIGEECGAFANSTQCHCGGAAIPKEKMRRYSNAPPVAELPVDRKKFCKRRKSGVESNRGPRAKSLILAGANSMQRTAGRCHFFTFRGSARKPLAPRNVKKHPRCSRGCAALAGAIGIEPTPWESEAHVLPLHQAPMHKGAP